MKLYLALPALLIVLASCVLGQRVPSHTDNMMDSSNRFAARDEMAKKLIAPAPADVQANKQFLKLPDTGITRLVFQVPCGIPPEERLKDLHKYAKECPTHYLQGSGSNFSFRRNMYVREQHADVAIKRGVIYSIGVLSHGIMVTLGHVPIDKISLRSEGVSFLDDFVPADNIAAADVQSLEIDKGIRQGKFLFARGFKVVQDTTYALRVIAYRANAGKEVELSASAQNKMVRKIENSSGPDLGLRMIDPRSIKFTDDPLYGDVRKDIIVVFRIIKVESDGSVTLIWRELKRTDSPKLEKK